jgi:tetratricopeptide (TPR) repeat protein
MVSGRQVKELLLDGKPSQLQEFDLEGIVKGNINDLEIRIIRGKEETGTISSVSRCIQKKASELREVPVFKEHSSESMTSWAEFEHKLLYRQRAMDLYEKAITLDSLNFRAHLGLGKLLFAHGDFRDAAKHFEKAIQAYKYDGEAYLMLAHIDHLAGNLSSASERAYDAVYFGEKCRGNLKLGELFIAKGEYGKAKNYLEEALVNNSRSLRAYALLALCDRKSGNIKLAQADLARTPSLPLKDMLWYSEAYLSGLINAQQMNAELFNDEWRYIEIGLDYLSLAAYKEADGMADAGVALHTQGWKLDKLFDPERMYGFMRKRENPFFYVIKGMAYQGMGESEKAADLFKKGDYFEYHVNFNQPELVPAMQAAIRAGNRFADYWLGNFLYHSLRPDEAYGHWKKASDKYPQHPQILRNLGLYSEFQNRDPETSISLFGKALEQNSNDLFMRLDLVTALRNNNAPPDEILKVYLAAPKEQRDTYLYQHGLLQAFKDAGKWSEAAEYLATVDRKWSDDVKSWYYFCIGYADYLVDHSKPKEALEWINKSSTVPANLSNVSLPVEYWYRQKEYYIAGLAFRMLGQEVQSREFFTRAINEQTDFLFNASSERGLQLQRFYAALSMKELGMDPSARSILNGINTDRIQHGLIVLKLEKKELMNWSVRDPLAENPSSDEH